MCVCVCVCVCVERERYQQTLKDGQTDIPFVYYSFYKYINTLPKIIRCLPPRKSIKYIPFVRIETTILEDD